MNRLLNFALFYLGWFACVAGAAQGYLWLGPSVVMGILLIHLSSASNRKEEARLILFAGILGFVTDTGLASAGLYAFSNTSVAPWLCPPWMVALWMLFATTLNSSMGWLAGRFAAGSVLGAVFGPLSYLGGARLGAIALHGNTPLALVVIAIAWAAAMPALLWLREYVSVSRAGLPRIPRVSCNRSDSTGRQAA